MTILAELGARVAPVDPAVAAETRRLLDDKTKPPGSLGQLEALAARLAAGRGVARPARLPAAIVVCGADHGVADERVSAYPSEVTAQMMLNFARGGAAINVLARAAGARLVVADLGVRTPLPPGTPVLDRRIAAGTGNFVRGPAMSEAQALAAIAAGAAIARDLAGDGVGLCAVGEMGIGNTTSASALTAALTGAPPAHVTGRGTGVDDAGLARKLAAIHAGLARHRAVLADPLATLAALGGLEIAGLCGVVLGAAAARIPVLLDGFISSVAGLVATRLVPAAAGYLIASHRSVERGHRAVLDALDLRPLLDLELRLGEGSGAALAIPLCDAALRILHEMATFADAGVATAT